MQSFKSFVKDVEENESQEQNVQDMLFGVNDYIPFEESHLKESVEDHPTNPKRIIFRGKSKGTTATGAVVPRHMWEGGKTAIGMKERNKARAEVYGSEKRDPLSLGEIENIHKQHLDEHFKKPEHEQIKAEKEALERLRKAKHLPKAGNTLDAGDKTDTVKEERDEEGRPHVAASQKGVAGHAVYTSGHGEHEEHHILNTCPGQTKGCGGGVDAKGVADTSKGTCFAPKAESQYAGASSRRAAQTQAKHDPAMTRDWILAHTHSLRTAAESADKKSKDAPKGKRFLFRPNVLDETDRSSRHAIKHLNKQRAAKGKPGIIANSYGKTNELHDPENGYHVTYSNTGPKVKDGKQISENIKRDNLRKRETHTATDAGGNHRVNDDGKKTPPKNSYMVTNMKRGSALDKEFQKHVTHAKYWSTGREEHELTDDEKKQGHEGHYDANGKPTTPDKAHYGHTTVNGRRYDYQKQHILHPRIVKVGDKDIPTDSRFKDNEHLPKNRFKSRNGKDAGAILATTPTESTSNEQHHSSFTHHVGPETIEHAKRNNGEYEIDNPHEQEKARGTEYVAPQTIKIARKKK